MCECSAKLEGELIKLNFRIFIYYSVVNTRAQFHGSAYRKHRIGAYGSRELCACERRISRVSSEFRLLRVLHVTSPAFYAYKASADICRLHVGGESRS